jgi:hypothetical protein
MWACMKGEKRRDPVLPTLNLLNDSVTVCDTDWLLSRILSWTLPALP